MTLLTITIATALKAIATAGGGVGTWKAVEKWLMPIIQKRFKTKQEKAIESIDVEKKLINLETDNSNLYTSQSKFLISQIDIYQKQVIKKTDELNEINLQFDELKQQCILMQKELFKLKQHNTKLELSYCGNVDCQNRIKK